MEYTDKIQVKSYKWINESITFGYYEFEICKQSEGKGEDVIFKRRFSEIEWLHNNLLKMCAGCKVYALPEKNFFTNTLLRNESIMIQRKDQIQKYLNYLNNHKFLSKNKHFIEFFSKKFETNRNDIQNNRSYFQSFKSLIGFNS